MDSSVSSATVDDSVTNTADGTEKDAQNLGALSSAWILTKEGPWFIDPSLGAQQIPSAPYLVHSACTVALVETEEWKRIRRTMSMQGMYVNNTVCLISINVIFVLFR